MFVPQCPTIFFSLRAHIYVSVQFEVSPPVTQSNTLLWAAFALSLKSVIQLAGCLPTRSSVLESMLYERSRNTTLVKPASARTSLRNNTHIHTQKSWDNLVAITQFPSNNLCRTGCGLILPALMVGRDGALARFDCFLSRETSQVGGAASQDVGLMFVQSWKHIQKQIFE